MFRGTWVAQSVGRLDFGSGLEIRGFKPHMGLCGDSLEPGACFRFCVSLSLSLSVPTPLMFFSSQK